MGGTDDLEINLQVGGMKLKGEHCSSAEQEGFMPYPGKCGGGGILSR